MEIISSLTPNINLPNDKKSATERVRSAAVHARSLVEKSADETPASSSFSTKIVGKLKDLGSESATLQSSISRLQSEQDALQGIRAELENGGSQERISELAEQAQFNGEPVANVDAAALTADPGAGIQQINARLDQITRQFEDLTGSITNLLVKTENILASGGGALESADVNGLIDTVKTSLQGGSSLGSNLSPEGVRSLL